MVHDLIVARYPELGLKVVNRGVGGDTTRNLLARWHQDVIKEKPDWLSVGIGINDVWRSFDGSPSEAVPIAEYEANLRRMLDQALEAQRPRLILMEPYMIERDRTRPMRHQMDMYGAVVKRV